MSLKTKAESLAFYMGIGLGDNSIIARTLCWCGHSETFESRAFRTPVMVAILRKSKVTKHTQLNSSRFSDAFSTRWFSPFKHIPGFAINRATLLLPPHLNQKSFKTAILQNTKSGRKATKSNSNKKQ